MTDVLIVDDHPVVLQGVRCIMEDAGVDVVHEATDIVGAYRMFHRLRPRTVIADLAFQGQGLSGLSLIRRMRSLARETRILAFSMHSDPAIVLRALECGAMGYVLKDAKSTEFLQAFEAVRAGQSYLDHDLAIEVAFLNSAPHHTPFATLNHREQQILSLLSKGISYQSISDKLSIKYSTVLNICTNIRQKLGARTLADLLQIGVAHDLSDLEFRRR